LVRPTEKEFGGEVPTQFATEGAFNRDGLKRELHDAGGHIAAASLARLEEFVRLGESSIPGLQEVIVVFRDTGNWEETIWVFSQPRCAAIRLRARELGKMVALKVIYTSQNT
jgi:hypothetical protein